MHLRAVWTPCCRQIDQLSETSLEWSQWVEGTSQVWDLMTALWGRLENYTGEETVKTHKIIMARRESVSKWLEKVVGRKNRLARLCRML